MYEKITRLAPPQEPTAEQQPAKPKRVKTGGRLGNVARDLARAAGQRYYVDPRNPCAIHGPQAHRHVSSNQCMACERIRERQRPKRTRKLNPSLYHALVARENARLIRIAEIRDELLWAFEEGDTGVHHQHYWLAVAEQVVDRRVERAMRALYGARKADHSDPWGVEQ
jgi:hypothetical protein